MDFPLDGLAHLVYNNCWTVIVPTYEESGVASAAPAQTLQQEVTEHEGSSVREAHLREVQDHPPQGQGHGDLRESQAQAEAGLIPGALPLEGPISTACILRSLCL